MKRSDLISRAIAGVVLMSGLAATAQGQSVVPSSARPDVIEREHSIQNERPDVGGSSLITMPAAPSKHISGGTTFMLHEVKLEGDTAIPQEELQALYKDKLDTRISIDDLNGIADSITNYYRNRGYILTRAVVPPQKAASGVVTIRIIEGYVNEVRLQGDKANDPQIQGYADKIRASKPLDAKTLERYLLLMNDLPGVTARAVLEPAANTQGASDVVVTVTRKFIDASISLDNRGSRYLGPEQLSGTVSLNNLIGYDDQTQLRGANSVFNRDELKYIELRHEEQIGNEGTKIVFSASRTETNPGYNLKDIDIEGISNAFSLGVNHPFIRSRQENWFVNSDFTVRNVDVDSLGADLYYDKTRVWTVGTTYDFLDSTSAINRMEFSTGHGFNLDANVDNQPHSRAAGQASFTKMNAKLSRLQPIVGPWSIYATAAGQYSFEALEASEQFALGGPEFGSAFDPAELTGDSGLAGRVELQFNEGRPDSTFLTQYQLYGFFDSGIVWNRDPAIGEVSNQSLNSTGIGARFNIIDSVTGSVEGALPIGQKVAAYGADGADPRVFFSLQYRY